jgi:hypothetical protein
MWLFLSGLVLLVLLVVVATLCYHRRTPAYNLKRWSHLKVIRNSERSLAPQNTNTNKEAVLVQRIAADQDKRCIFLPKDDRVLVLNRNIHRKRIAHSIQCAAKIRTFQRNPLLDSDPSAGLLLTQQQQDTLLEKAPLFWVLLENNSMYAYHPHISVKPTEVLTFEKTAISFTIQTTKPAKLIVLYDDHTLDIYDSFYHIEKRMQPKPPESRKPRCVHYFNEKLCIAYEDGTTALFQLQDLTIIKSFFIKVDSPIVRMCEDGPFYILTLTENGKMIRYNRKSGKFVAELSFPKIDKRITHFEKRTYFTDNQILLTLENSNDFVLVEAK